MKRMMKTQTGFSLIEVLVAMTVLLIILSATLGAFNDALRVNEVSSLTTDVNQNLRAGINLMIRDMIQAGTGIPTGGIPIPLSGVPINRPSPPTLNYTFPVGNTVISAVTPGAFLGLPVNAGPATDIVTVMYVDSSLLLNQLPLTAIGPVGESMTVGPNPVITNANNGIRPGDLIMFTNAQGNALQQVTRVSGGQTVFFDAGDFFGLNQTGAPSGGILSLQTPPGSGVYPVTTAARILMVSYFIDPVTNLREPRLMRQVNSNPAQPVALAAENLQISFYMSDGVNTNTKDPSTLAPPQSDNLVRKVNLFLGARSYLEYSKGGQFVRNGLATQVSFRSLSYVDRY